MCGVDATGEVPAGASDGSCCRCWEGRGRASPVEGVGREEDAMAVGRAAKGVTEA